ncbi:hypothetical protein V7167_26695, partial [Bacillus toyonensis]|uniref:hypothetical protein n=1 Tax=Bacillus toyonensis TaxID=155322 RepID=UPI002FFE2657
KKKKRIQKDSFFLFIRGKVFYEIHRSLITPHYIEYIGINVYIFHESCEFFVNFMIIIFLSRINGQ